jgi:ATP-dependent Clp protease protease subunit
MEDTIDKVLLRNRRVFLSEAVTSESARNIIRKLWYLELQEPGKPILFVINSPGGSVDAGFAIWDQIQLISSPVTTLVTGLAASMGSVLSLAAKKGRRFATPRARFLIHQPLIGGVIKGQASDLDIQAQQLIKTRKMIISTYAEKTGKSEEEIERDIDRDNWKSAQEAYDYGLIDKIVTSFAECEPKK